MRKDDEIRIRHMLVKVFILDRLYESLPRPPFTEAETDDVALRVYDYVWERSASGHDLSAA